jgi:hypothetical protein
MAPPSADHPAPARGEAAIAQASRQQRGRRRPGQPPAARPARRALVPVRSGACSGAAAGKTSPRQRGEPPQRSSAGPGACSGAAAEQLLLRPTWSTHGQHLLEGDLARRGHRLLEGDLARRRLLKGVVVRRRLLEGALGGESRWRDLRRGGAFGCERQGVRGRMKSRCGAGAVTPSGLAGFSGRTQPS